VNFGQRPFFSNIGGRKVLVKRGNGEGREGFERLLQGRKYGGFYGKKNRGCEHQEVLEGAGFDFVKCHMNARSRGR